MDEDTILLTTSQAVDAICIDFQQYAPQIIIFGEVLRLISENRIHLQRQLHKDGAWVNGRDGAKMKWLTGKDLTEFMCRTIRETTWHPQLLATVCGCVFQAKAVPAVDPKTAKPGVCINTNMSGYACRQCGRCCRLLDYHNEVKAEDVSRWRDAQREDIIKWVKIEKTKDLEVAYRVWVDPDTGWVATPCPFLNKDKAHNRYECLIHDVKPDICRQYPISRKHAVMTGCRGFETPKSQKS